MSKQAGFLFAKCLSLAPPSSGEMVACLKGLAQNTRNLQGAVELGGGMQAVRRN